jgi:hypothetical protein
MADGAVEQRSTADFQAALSRPANKGFAEAYRAAGGK